MQNLNFEISQNQTVAIIGENGSGKTTLMKLLLGLYFQYDGKILINGHELNTIKKNHIMKNYPLFFRIL